MSEASIQSYRDLRVWQLAMEQAQTSYEVTRSWPKEEQFGLTSQLRRAAVSIPANIAEGFGRESGGSFVQFLRIAQGSPKEYETHVILAGRIGFIDEKSASGLLAQSDNLGRMLGSLIRKVAATPPRAALYDKVSQKRPTTDDRRPTPVAGGVE